MVVEDEIKAYIDKHFEEFMQTHMNLRGPFKVVSEYALPNNQLVDKVIIGTDNKVLALIECKGEVGTNEFVAGIGQAMEGAFHIKKNIEGSFSDTAKSFLIVPIEMSEKLSLNLFEFPNTTLVLVNTKTGQSVEYREGSYIAEKPSEWITINPYYFRDCSLEGIYFYLKMILKNSAIRDKKTLSQMEEEVRKVKEKTGKEFFGDVRNNHIVPSVLGFYDQSDRNLTVRGYEFAKKSFLDFCREIVLTELGEYSRAVFVSILALANGKKPDEEGFYDISTHDIEEYIKTVYQGKKVTYLFDPDEGSRNLLTMIRMLETIGALIRDGRNKIKVGYMPFEGMPFLMKESRSANFKFWFEKFGLDF